MNLQPPDYAFQYKGYTISCAPDPAPNGTFQTKVVATERRSGAAVIVALKGETEPFATAQEAAQAGIQAGIAFVDSYRA